MIQLMSLARQQVTERLSAVKDQIQGIGDPFLAPVTTD
jgi:Cu/Ag efflux pump CusA